MHAAQTLVRRKLRHGGLRQHLLEQSGERLLPLAGHQKAPKGEKTAPLVRIANRIALAHDFIQQCAF